MVAIVLAVLLLAAQPAAAGIPPSATTASSSGYDESGPAPYASLLYVEGDLDLATSTGEDGATADRNSPLGAGDQLTTREGRAELVLPDGSRVWLDRNTRLDLLDLTPTPLLRLWRGAIALDLDTRGGGGTSAGAAWPRVDSPAGTIDLLEDGRYRIAASPDGYVHVTVESGLAEVGGRRSSVLVRSGQRTSVLPGDDPENAYVYNTATVDELARFVEQRLDQTATHVEYAEEEAALPAPVALHAADLDRYGSWRYYEPLGTNVWSPRVTAGWRPYHDGYWATYPDGVTWVSYEPFGYVTSHYGGWDYAPSFGWFWVPGDLYSPAWVDWYVYDDYVGWCPRSSYRYVDRHGRRHWRDARVVHQRIDRPFESDRGVIVRRDGFFNGRIRDVSVSADQVRGRRPERRERLDARDFVRGSARERLGRTPTARDFVRETRDARTRGTFAPAARGGDAERDGVRPSARDFVREQGRPRDDVRVRETTATPAAPPREPSPRELSNRADAERDRVRPSAREFVREQGRQRDDVRVRDTTVTPAAPPSAPSRGGDAERDRVRPSAREFVREQGRQRDDVRVRETTVTPAAPPSAPSRGGDAERDRVRPSAREFVREQGRQRDDVRVRETTATPAAPRREPSRGGDAERDETRPSPRELIRDVQRQTRSREGAEPAAADRDGDRRPSAREFVREQQRRPREEQSERAEPARRESNRNAGSDSTVPGALWRHLRGGDRESREVRESAPERRVEAPRESPPSRVSPEPKSRPREERAERTPKGNGNDKGKDRGERSRGRSRK